MFHCNLNNFFFGDYFPPPKFAAFWTIFTVVKNFSGQLKQKLSSSGSDAVQHSADKNILVFEKWTNFKDGEHHGHMNVEVSCFTNVTMALSSFNYLTVIFLREHMKYGMKLLLDKIKSNNGYKLPENEGPLIGNLYFVSSKYISHNFTKIVWENRNDR